jgi:hypothetical protein
MQIICWPNSPRGRFRETRLSLSLLARALHQKAPPGFTFMHPDETTRSSNFNPAFLLIKARARVPCLFKIAHLGKRINENPF